MTDIPLLSLTIFLPCLGALVVLLIKEDESSINNIKNVALWTSVGVFLLSLLIWLQFDNSKSGYQFEENSDGSMILIFITMLELMEYHFLWLS